MNHTPGPWEEHVIMVKHHKIDEKRLPGESWLDMRDRTKPLRDAAGEKEICDLRLANAAPEMLEALIEGVITYQDFFDDSDECLYIQRHISVIEKATGMKYSEVMELHNGKMGKHL